MCREEYYAGGRKGNITTLIKNSWYETNLFLRFILYGT